jgi:hypothetical protein
MNIAHAEHDVGAMAGEFNGSLIADAAIGSRDESSFAKEGRDL